MNFYGSFSKGKRIYENKLTFSVDQVRLAAETMTQPCVKRQATLVECVKYGIDTSRARLMTSAELTSEDLYFLLSSGVTLDVICDVYQIAHDDSEALLLQSQLLMQ